jgi:predicted amidohydrolase
MDPPPLRVAVTQLECEWLDLERSIEKTVKAFAEAAKNSAKFVVFPECWIPGYPAWI